MKQRPAVAVLADMVEGVIAANGLDGVQAADLRDLLWGALADLVADLSPSPPERTAEVRAIRAA